jgi:predicted DsbA family dithiol-disulfide isomerase
VDEWLPFEIHPETPPEGVLLTASLPHIDWDGMYRNLRKSGERFGIKFGNVRLLSNAGMSLAAGEFARDCGGFEAYHEAIFNIYFTQARDIGSWEAVREAAEAAGLDTAELKKALDAGRYRQRLAAVTGEAHRRGINSAPTFIINNTYAIVGAQPVGVFRDALIRAGNQSL